MALQPTLFIILVFFSPFFNIEIVRRLLHSSRDTVTIVQVLHVRTHGHFIFSVVLVQQIDVVADRSLWDFNSAAKSPPIKMLQIGVQFVLVIVRTTLGVFEEGEGVSSLNFFLAVFTFFDLQGHGHHRM